MDWSQPPETPVLFDLDTTEGTNASAIIEDEEDTAVRDNPGKEFLRWHHKLNHMSAAKMQAMARQGLLPKKLAKCQVPTCTSCLYGRTTRRPWRTKPRLGHQGGKLLHGHRVRTVCQRQPTGVFNSRTNCPNERLAHQEEIPRGNYLC